VIHILHIFDNFFDTRNQKVGHICPVSKFFYICFLDLQKPVFMQLKRPKNIGLSFTVSEISTFYISFTTFLTVEIRSKQVRNQKLASKQVMLYTICSLPETVFNAVEMAFLSLTFSEISTFYISFRTFLTLENRKWV